jgi:hypothetical protein
MEGYVPATAAADYGVSFRDLSAAAVVIPGDAFLTTELASEWVTKLSTKHPTVTIYYFRGSPEFDPQALPPGITAKRVPFDLGV